MQLEQGVTTSIQNFLLAMVGLSVAAERVTEVVKQWICPKGGSAALVQTIAIGSGVLVTALSTLDPLNITHGAVFSWSNREFWLCWIVTGILVSGGSAFWNHLLDILQATKVKKEEQAYGTGPQPVQAQLLPSASMTPELAAAGAGD